MRRKNLNLEDKVLTISYSKCPAFDLRQVNLNFFRAAENSLLVDKFSMLPSFSSNHNSLPVAQVVEHPTCTTPVLENELFRIACTS